MSTAPLARRERHALCDLALLLGEDAPSLCGDWTAKDLVAHLLVRENRPIGALGIALGPLSGLADHAMRRVAKRDFGVLVEKLRDPGLTPYRLRPVEVVANTLEYFVHHEDLRRAQPGWQPRELGPADEAALWRAVRLAGKVLTKSVGVPLQIRRTDTDSPERTIAILRRGDDPVTVAGRPSELVLFLYGRTQLSGLTFDGPESAVAKVSGWGSRPG